MIWMEMCEKELYRSETYSRKATDAIRGTLKSISEDVFPSVGFLDVVDKRVYSFKLNIQVT